MHQAGARRSDLVVGNVHHTRASLQQDIISARLDQQIQENLLQNSHFALTAFRSAIACFSSAARLFRRLSSSSSNSLKPPASPVRFASRPAVPYPYESSPTAWLARRSCFVTFFASRLGCVVKHLLHSFRLAQFQLPQASLPYSDRYCWAADAAPRWPFAHYGLVQP
eukprot:CAMPEP_0181206160 /NCGR_PEP_ID=MMETSP1096-20121128/20882_1 /TAXON_ID=156174 ORGANISM="Chrysochromulina ericina, Strain CCMP281" /NCGR_SAMPLE_ID=MMETSP1096 /ASSEMBLY_ACC=CAM_ASM_000453 /LENGTH=166 /DNA_ID=CAMNT_0023297031 /DNA_START=247 /DNA_END=747 /DNA_ORIENTATION=-